MSDQVEIEIPKKARDLMEKGMSALERKNYDFAMDMFLASLDIEPRFLQARKLLRATSIKKFKETGGVMTRVLAAVGGVLPLVAGFLAIKSGKSAKALRMAENLLRKDPLFPPFIRLSCKAAEACGMPEVAVHTLSLARDNYPDNVKIISWLGRLYTATNQLAEARECFEKVVELRPHDAIAVRDLKDAMARDTMSKGGWHEVADKGGTYRDLIRDARAAAAREQEEKLTTVERDLDLLIEESEEKLKRSPENMAERRAVANLYAQAERFDEAIRVLEDGRRIAGINDPAMDQLLSVIRMKQIDHEIARRRKEGDVAGAAAMEKKKKEFVFRDVESRVKQYPNDLALRFEYGVLLYERRQFNEAVQQFQIAERNPSQRVRSLYYIGLCFKEKGQLDMAKDQLEKAASGLQEMDDLKKDIFYQLGLILEKAGNMEQAVNDYYKAIYQVDIGYRDVAEKIEAAYRNRQDTH